MGDNVRDGAMAALRVAAERLVHQHPRPVLHPARAGGQRAQPRSELERLSRALLRRHVPAAARCSAIRTRRSSTARSWPATLNQRRAAGAQLPVQDRRTRSSPRAGTTSSRRATGRSSRDVSYSKAERNEQQYETNAQFVPDAAPAGRRATCTTPAAFSIIARQHAHAELPAGLRRLRRACRSVRRSTARATARFRASTDELTSGRIDVGRTLDNGWCPTSRSARTTRIARRTSSSPKAASNTIGGGYLQIAGEHLLAPTNLSLRERRQRAGVGRRGSAARLLPADRLRHADHAGLRLPDRQELDREREGRHRVRQGRSRSRDLLQRDFARQHRRAVRRHRPELGRVLQGQTRPNQVLPLQRRQEVRGRAAGDQSRVPAAGRSGGARRPRARVGARPHGPAQGVERVRLSRRAPAVPRGSGGNPQLDPWRANAFDLSYEKYFGTNAYVSVAGVLQGPEELHLQSDQRQLRLLGATSPRCRRATSRPA